MAAAIVSASMGAIGTLLPKLSVLIQGEYSLQKALRTKIAFLSNELSSMQTLLVKLADNEERLDEQLKDWRNKVRELSYDIEDCIDLFMHKISEGGDKANLIKKTVRRIKKMWSRHKIANLIDEPKARVEESSRRLRYKYDDQATNFSKVVCIDPRLPALYVEAEKLVGIDDPREEIIEFLKNDDNGHQLKIVFIVGFGGLGKTTLANQVYQKIKGQFDCSCFVPVSRNPNVAKILANMHIELKGPFDASDDERQLIDKIRAFLQDKRYFIVVDDIWSIEAWKLVKSALPENSLNSRIITITRISNVATSCCTGLAGYVHNIQPLSNQQSQKLFFKRVFGENSSCPPHLEQVSFGILKKCQGLPLATVTIGSLLAGKSNKDQWEQVYNSICSAFNHEGMRNILLLSYYDLPYHLKTCLLYLSVYPEDDWIETEELIWRWIAEGFIADERGQTVDQVAESYFNELVNRNLIQPRHILYDGRVQYFKVHDMVLELIVSLSDEENFASIVEGQNYNGTGHQIRRLSVHNEHVGNEVMQKIMDKWSQVRSIIFYRMQEQGISHLHNLHHLRVLVFSSESTGNQHIKYIGSLFQLKFLAIHSSDVTELPEDIGNLRYLQTLDIRDCLVRKLPPSICYLQKLEHLLANSVEEVPDEIRDLQALRELSGVWTFSIKLVQALRNLSNLKRLSMCMSITQQLGHDVGRYQEALKSSLAVMGNHGLQSLGIWDFNDFLTEELVDLLCSIVPCLGSLMYMELISLAFRSRWRLLLISPILNLGFSRFNRKISASSGAYLVCSFATYTYSAPLMNSLPSAANYSRALNCLATSMLDTEVAWRCCSYMKAMPRLRRLDLAFRVQETESKMGFEFSFEHLASLEQINVTIRTEDATTSRLEAAEAAIRGAISMHPGRPTHTSPAGHRQKELLLDWKAGFIIRSYLTNKSSDL